MKAYFTLCMVSILLYSCGGNKETAPTTRPAEDEEYTVPDWQNDRVIWMEMEPVQCLGNPWQQTWISQQDRTESDYPVGNPRLVEAQEKEIIIDYYAAQGVNVIEVDSRPFPNDRVVCDACSCPQGYTLFLKVTEGDAEQLAEMGFRKSERL